MPYCHMPWNKDDYPDAMKNLDEAVREKAIEIANALTSTIFALALHKT